MRPWPRSLHHSYDRVHTEYGAPRSQNTAIRARGGGESDEKKYTAKFRKTPPPQAFFQLYDEEDAERGVRPGSVFDPVPQGRLVRHVVEHRIETCPFVQILDAPVPQLGNQVLELLQKIVSSLVEPVQVIEVPKMFMPTRCPRTVLSVPQTAEQLVDVPTMISYSSLQRAIEQTIDIPVLRLGGEVAEVFKVFVQDRVLQQRMWSRSLNFRFLSVAEEKWRSSKFSPWTGFNSVFGANR